eukprot:10055557-Ditylum_brightwellii.AAC.1
MTVYLDNEGMFNRIVKQKTYLFNYSFHTIDPDWDTIAQICDILATMNIKAEFKHVKGYQDDDTPYKELDLPAKLNTNVDVLAIGYRTTKGMKCTKVMWLPINKIQLHASDSTITLKYCEIL